MNGLKKQAGADGVGDDIEARRARMFERRISRSQAAEARAGSDPLSPGKPGVQDAHVQAWRRIVAIDLIARSFQCGDEILIRIVPPDLQRAVRGDLDIVDLEASQGKGLTKVVRARGLGSRLLGKGFPPELVRVALRLARDFEKARPSRLTASYEGGINGRSSPCESERFLLAIDVLSHATACLDKDQRVALYGAALLDVGFADLGAMIGGPVGGNRVAHLYTGKLYLRKALERLDEFYADWDFKADERPSPRYSA